MAISIDSRDSSFVCLDVNGCKFCILNLCSDESESYVAYAMKFGSYFPEIDCDPLYFLLVKNHSDMKLRYGVFSELGEINIVIKYLISIMSHAYYYFPT